jgi:hypothetical protein
MRKGLLPNDFFPAQQDPKEHEPFFFSRLYEFVYVCVMADLCSFFTLFDDATPCREHEGKHEKCPFALTAKKSKRGARQHATLSHTKEKVPYVTPQRQEREIEQKQKST